MHCVAVPSAYAICQRPRPSRNAGTYHSSLHPLVRFVEEPFHDGLGVQCMLLESGERSPRRPVFYCTERFKVELRQRHAETHVQESCRRGRHLGHLQLQWLTYIHLKGSRVDHRNLLVYSHMRCSVSFQQLQSQYQECLLGKVGVTHRI